MIIEVKMEDFKKLVEDSQRRIFYHVNPDDTAEFWIISEGVAFLTKVDMKQALGTQIPMPDEIDSWIKQEFGEDRIMEATIRGQNSD